MDVWYKGFNTKLIIATRLPRKLKKKLKSQGYLSLRLPKHRIPKSFSVSYSYHEDIGFKVNSKLETALSKAPV